jgi:hypothetical protein
MKLGFVRSFLKLPPINHSTKWIHSGAGAFHPRPVLEARKSLKEAQQLIAQ